MYFCPLSWYIEIDKCWYYKFVTRHWKLSTIVLKEAFDAFITVGTTIFWRFCHVIIESKTSKLDTTLWELNQFNIILPKHEVRCGYLTLIISDVFSGKLDTYCAFYFIHNLLKANLLLAELFCREYTEYVHNTWDDSRIQVLRLKALTQPWPLWKNIVKKVDSK